MATRMQCSAALALLLTASTHAQVLQVKVQAWGTDALRFQIAPPGLEISDPIVGALNSTTPPRSRDHSVRTNLTTQAATKFE